VKHCAVAIWQGNYGEGEDREEGRRYIQSLALKQERNGAHYLDVNVDEFSTDVQQRVELMGWTVNTVQQVTDLPVAIDSSNMEILESGLNAAAESGSRTMVNSVSLERFDAIDTAKSHNAVVIASASGKEDLPSDVDGRMSNLQELMPELKNRGFEDPEIHIDPLVLPISTDSRNGKGFLEAVSRIRREYGSSVHIVAGLSNVSFGMPKRKLINQVFSYLAVEAGADGGIVDPGQINSSILNALDTEGEAFKAARDLLLGEDEFGMNYITACREGRI
jgi:5-methyltetrahydrofolate--homocysteine methyltransferase